ncbi:hypothetical protein K450DRAFT_253214 [Umbelopsis ramanniana AG]|uniref:DUF7082 domain-containing protein n=1 Tax=Umbelopsis ramanniana AG TaxID=1314678 RepID=A0AAD5E5S7_UMBRA|nr:uncharacterized protein K450DRAFT_253214 [Umbelopsis ramanniana AG]KAI8577174.1 hypothetical protein K450DRAFT_253214 [Umbelopsis ramanniana AG]
METTLSPAPALTLGSNFELRPKQSNTDYQKLAAQGYIHTPHTDDHHSDNSNMAADRKDEGPRVLECGPSEGPAGTTVRVVLQTFPSNPALKLAFGGLVVDTKQLDNANFTNLAAIVPMPNQTHSVNNAPQIPISVCVYENDAVHNSWVIGEFTYSEGQANKNERKRLYGADPFMANKRMHEDDSFFPHADHYQNFYSMENGVLPQNPYAFAQMQQQAIRPQDPSAKGGKPMVMDGYYRSQAPPQMSYPTYASMPGLSNQQRSPYANNGGMTDHRAMSQAQPPYTDYSGLLNKANLKIIGDLDTMAQAWTSEEWNARRRLVQFWRRQEGNEIHCEFQAVQQADRQPNSIVVSCIFWQERNDCFITSVDCIYLLESLIGVRFTVEEKNRIRRNLEGFRPLTVSKCKPDSADFFKLIMSFPNPKPRNIEKDVKVFPWKTLPYALKKIIGKYTASYSSTAGIM